MPLLEVSYSFLLLLLDCQYLCLKIVWIFILNLFHSNLYMFSILLNIAVIHLSPVCDELEFLLFSFIFWQSFSLLIMFCIRKIVDGRSWAIEPSFFFHFHSLHQSFDQIRLTAGFILQDCDSWNRCYFDDCFALVVVLAHCVAYFHTIFVLVHRLSLALTQYVFGDCCGNRNRRKLQ